MKLKEYKIETITDIIDSTNIDNIDSFLLDLKAVIVNAHFIKSIDNKVKISKNYTWIDDGVNKLVVDLVVDKINN